MDWRTRWDEHPLWERLESAIRGIDAGTEQDWWLPEDEEVVARSSQAFSSLLELRKRPNPFVSGERINAVAAAIPSDVSGDSLRAMWSSHTRTLSSLFAGSTFGDVKQDELELRIDNAQRSLDRLTAQIPGATAAVANGKYAEWAEAQEATANKFRTMAICLFVTAVLFTFVSALWGMLSSTDESVNWLALGSKFAAGAGLTALGGYLAREGTKHRRDGLAAREIELAIATIEGYFQDDESRTIMREAYARGVFVQSTQSRIRLRDNAKASDDTGDMLATLDTALGVAQKARAMGG